MPVTVHQAHTGMMFRCLHVCRSSLKSVFKFSLNMGQALFSHHSLMSSVFVKGLSSFCCSSGRSLLYLLCICKLLLNKVWFKWLWWHFIGSCWVLCVLFVFTHYPFSGSSISAFWLNSNFSICFVWFLSLFISYFLPELVNFHFSFNLVINYYSFFFLVCLIVAIITVDLWYFLVASTCVQQKKNVGLIFSNILILQRHYWTLLSGWATCWRVVGWCECFTHPRVSV